MAELPCYTLINNPSETEIPNEQQLRNDLGKADAHPAWQLQIAPTTHSSPNNAHCLYRARGQQVEGSCTEEGDSARVEWRTFPRVANGDNPVCVAVQ